jgi:hypothetical protein
MMSAHVMPTPLEPTPQERLTTTRNAIIRHMARGDDASQTYAEDESKIHGYTDSVSGGVRPGHGHSDSNWSVIKKTVAVWWHHHPAHVAFDVATPVVESYTRNHPLKVLGIAAGLGAAAVWIKPWRLVSMGGLAALALRSTNITGAVFSMLTPSRVPSAPSRGSDNSASDNYRNNKDIP